MAVYGYSNTAGDPSPWTRRLAVSLDFATASTSPGDYDVTIPKGLDDFWQRIDASGNELRVVSWDSQTLLSYSVDNGSGGAFDRTNRLGRLRLDGVAVSGSVEAGMYLAWLYYGSTSTQGTAAVATTMASVRAGYIETARPGMRRVRYEPPGINLTRPRTVLPAKRSQEAVYIWVDVTGALSRQIQPTGGAHLYEEAFWATSQIVNSSSTDQPTMYDNTKNRWVYEMETGRTYLRVYCTGGSSGTNYTLACRVGTILPGASAFAQTITPIAGLPVRDLVLTS